MIGLLGIILAVAVPSYASFMARQQLRTVADQLVQVVGRLHHWLVAHPRFGPMIHDWHLRRAVSRRAKWAATWTMLASAVILLALMLWTGSHRWWMVALPMACMAVVGAWLWMRPEPPRSD